MYAVFSLSFGVASVVGMVRASEAQKRRPSMLIALAYLLPLAALISILLRSILGYGLMEWAGLGVNLSYSVALVVPLIWHVSAVLPTISDIHRHQQSLLSASATRRG